MIFKHNHTFASMSELRRFETAQNLRTDFENQRWICSNTQCNHKNYMTRSHCAMCSQPRT